MKLLRFLIFIIVYAMGSEARAGAAEEGGAFFDESIRPLLETRCFKCHSHASGKMKGGLTLDSRGGWAKGGNHGPAIVPGKPELSLLIKAIRHTDEDLKMPPDEKMPEAEIAALVEWVKRGAPDPRASNDSTVSKKDPKDWWSLKPLRRPGMPQSAARSGGRLNPIDAFVRERLTAKGLAPSPSADRRTLIRRIHFDLHGLPPTPDDVAAFVMDSDPLAYEKRVESLLNSPRFGERWARHWLDTIHFADSHGCEHDALRPNAWRFRDYVIESINLDTPWPRFIREQLAADAFYPDEPRLTVALGFIGAGPFELSRFSTAPKTFAYLDRDDMVTQTMAAFASVTANCARCHDHKFDPISQEDYYALQAVFAGVGKGEVRYDEDLGLSRRRGHWRMLAQAVEEDDRAILLAAEHESLVDEWERAFESDGPRWRPLRPETYLSDDAKVTLKRLDDDSILSGGTAPAIETYTVTATTTETNITAVRLDVLTDDSLPLKGPGRQDNGNLHLSEFQIRLFREGADSSEAIGIARATADWDQEGWTIAHAIDGKKETAWGVYPKVGESHYAVFELAVPIVLKKPAKLAFTLKQLHGGKHVIGRFRLSTTDMPGLRAHAMPRIVEEALRIPRAMRNAEQQAAVARRALSIRANDEMAILPPLQRVYAAGTEFFVQGKRKMIDAPRTVHVLERGDIGKPGAEANPGALSAIGELPGRFELADANDEASRRAALADWLASPENPLTWRSAVNRVWQYHFGRGLCDTPNDFGRMGGTPSHPELLDWLAVWFRDDANGSLKELHRLILTSETYQQMSTSVGQGADAANRLLARMNRRRLDAEEFRDAVLQISGRIDCRMGGPGVQQFTLSKGQQVTPQLHYDAFEWNHADSARRSIYRVVWRGIADPFMEALDFPDLGLLAPNRSFSVSSLQALTLFNNDFVLHHCERLAERLERLEVSDDARISLAFRLAFQREPTNGELQEFAAYAEKHGLPAMCRLLFNSNEFLFVE